MVVKNGSIFVAQAWGAPRVITSTGALADWLAEPEGEHLEFKEASENYQFEKLVKYCAALANEGGGKMILGVTDKRPRAIVGTNAFAEPARTVAGLVDRLRLKVECEEIRHDAGRVLVFHVPPRPLGLAIEAEGAFWMRAGETLRAMRTN